MMTDPAPEAYPNRFAGLARPFAAGLIALLAALMLFGLAGGTGDARIAAADERSIPDQNSLVGDHMLYAHVLRRVEAGESYYTAVAAEHRVHHYPLRPFMAVRLPTLLWSVAAIGMPAALMLGMLVGVAAIWAWWARLRADPTLPASTRIAALFVAANLSQLLAREWALFHEVAAGALIALALALYRPARPWATMAIVAVALSIRETVLPVAMLFGLLALFDRDWRAVAGWLVVGLAFLGGLAAHISALAAVTTPADMASPGWSGLGGWGTYVAFVRETSILRIAPSWIAALLVPLALFGWASWKSRLGLAGFGIQAIYALLFMLAARPDNFYWAMLVAPTLFIGLIFVPAALFSLFHSLRSRPSASVATV